MRNDYNQRMYRSRMQKTEEKRNARLAFWLFGIVVLLLIIIVLWGIPLLVKLAVVIGDINSSKQPVDRADVIPPAPPQIGVPYIATNSATLQVYGSTEPGATVYLTRNKAPMGTVVAKDDGTFQFNDVKLSDGKNEFTAVAMDGAGNTSQPSSNANVIYSTKQPQLQIDSPTDGQTFSSKDATIDIKGKTDAGVRLLLNERVVLVNGSGVFQTKYSLTNGDNTLTFVATDTVGNAITKEIVVHYNNPSL